MKSKHKKFIKKKVQYFLSLFSRTYLFLSNIMSKLQQTLFRFDPEWYLKEYPNVKAAGIYPLKHFKQHGKKEGRRPKGPKSKSSSTCIHEYLPSNQAPLQAPNGINVTVIIPVYLGYKETKQCITSVLKRSRNFQKEIIVIDDNSPDILLKRWLKKLAAKNLITLIENRENLGYIASINIGIAASKSNDVILLNSDTEVPQNWIERLSGHAYFSTTTGTVTPFSNNATICSWPTIQNHNNQRLVYKNIQELDEAFQKANCGFQVPIPVAVGFCMYIRRDCLNATGEFNEEVFEKGYGEENDFCIRASKLGWNHVLACDIFVYHKGEVSFGKDSINRRLAENKLFKIYPNYNKLIAKHLQKDLAKPFRFAAVAADVKQSNKPTILLITHHLGGGTEKHINDLIEFTGEKANFLKLEPSGFNQVKLSVPKIPGMFIHFGANELDKIIKIIKSFGTNKVHIHHLIGLEINLRQLIDLLGLPFDLTIHDYFSVCPQINLINSDNFFCREPSLSKCNICIAQKPKFGSTDITAWRNHYSWLFNEADRVICPSKDTYLRIKRYAPNANLIFISHEIQNYPKTVKLNPLSSEKILRIGLIGVIDNSKGREALISAVKECDSSRFEFIIIGRCDPPLPKKLKKIVKETGKYEEADLLDLLKKTQIHVAWFPSICPETYCYTLSSALNASLPIIAPNIGAFPERLKDRPLTWIRDYEDANSSWISIFEEVYQIFEHGLKKDPLLK